MPDQLVVETTDSVASLNLEALENRVQARMSGRVRSLRLHVHECGIVMRGVARTYHAKQVAQHAIMAETAVPILANEIEVS
jgi:hypothetical protein